MSCLLKYRRECQVCGRKRSRWRITGYLRATNELTDYQPEWTYIAS